MVHQKVEEVINMKSIRSFIKIVDHQTIIVMVLAIISTYLCGRFRLLADMPSGLIGIAIIFPIVFSINAAYRRREEALRYFASFKAHAVALFYAHRDWTPSKDNEDRERIIGLIRTLFTNTRDYFSISDEKSNNQLFSVYKFFSQISKSHEKLREKNVPANEISRANQYLRAMIIEFERMKNILRYRTPISLRSYSHIFVPFDSR